MLTFFPEERNRGLGRLNNLPRVTQVLRGEDGIYMTQDNLIPEAKLFSYDTCNVGGRKWGIVRAEEIEGREGCSTNRKKNLQWETCQLVLTLQ